MSEELVLITKKDLTSLIKSALQQVLQEQNIDKYAHRQKFSPKEAAEFTNRSEAFIRKLISTNRIPYQKEGKPVFLLRVDLLLLKK